jgi:SnoaL-like domain
MPLAAEDRLAIHELIALHGHLADDRRPEDLGLLLSADAVYDVEDYGLGKVTGLPAIQDLFSERPGQQPLGHHVTNIMVTERPDGTVHARSKGLAVMPDGGADTVTYDDTLVRTAAGWRIARRKVVKPRTD